ncbi:MAG: tRNA (guanosine(46)-N7)-methyltransferase TrmB [Hyphomicrobiales bacterium]
MGEDRSHQGAQSRGEVRGGRQRYRFYGRRKGHALRRRHLQLVETLLPKLRIDLAAPLSGLTPPVRLEIGFGGGEHLARQAELNPDISFIGAEPFVNGVAKLLALIEEKKLANIRIHDGDVRYLLEALPAGSLERIYLLYPDPWPKARHAKRRFVNAENLGHVHRLLAPGGLFLFASDIADYVEWTRERVAAHGGFAEDGEAAQPFEDWVETRYEAKARREGRVPFYLRFRKT